MLGMCVGDQPEKVDVVRVQLQRPEHRCDFGLKLAGDLLRVRQPQPDVRPIGFRLEGCFQVGNSLGSFARFAIVDPKKKIGSGKPRFEFEGAPER